MGKETIENSEVNNEVNFVQVAGDKTKIDSEVSVSNSGEKELWVSMYDGQVRDTTESVPFTAISFEEYDEAVESRKDAERAKKDADVFKDLIDNILHQDDINKANAIMDLSEEFVARSEEYLTKELKTKDESEIKEEGDQRKLQHPFMIFKDKEGITRFVTMFSNNARDQDNPSEIIASESHENFVKMVDSEIAPLPELWLWHIPEWKLGETEVVAYDKEAGIAIASGYFYKEAEPIAQVIAASPDFWGVSHGFYSVERSKEDESIITKHITKEISPLPAYAAANKWASFQILKEANMGLTDEKVKKLAESGVDEEILEGLQVSIDNTNKAIDALGVERKEEATLDEEEETQDQKETSEEPKEEIKEEIPEAKEEEEEKSTAFSEEQAAELKEVFELFEAKFINAVKEIVEPLQEAAQEQKEITEEFDMQTPAMSKALTDMIFPGEMQKKMSATNTEETKVDGREKIAKGPKEVKEDAPSIVQTGNPFVNGIVNGIFAEQEEAV